MTVPPADPRGSGPHPAQQPQPAGQWPAQPTGQWPEPTGQWPPPPGPQPGAGPGQPASPPGSWAPPPPAQPWTPPGQPARASGALPWIVGGAILGVLALLVGAAVLVVRLGAGDDGNGNAGRADPPAAAGTGATAATPKPTAAAQSTPPALPDRPGAVTSPSTARPELATRPLAEEGTLRSGTQGAATEVTFVNARQDFVTVYWLDFEGKRVRYQHVPSGAQYTQQTYATHAWLVCDAGGGALVIVVATEQPGQVTVR
ncbi:hypothetical protein Daura_33995 [Dactylosporangium aurantiacum]|uniref:von Hippel-Lindau disease tumour suppressor beta domain-containing protein n=1 Tax=Dactylosporangium aurantiacum TaxID=35754 RepID=A0A9Q9IE23_9ACTN|nr:hypothetical protein [Dactylosporangium aurantiacum]MDG6105206.1 hypothetical protein [Dactylosporangium aurantiacum]UWZ51724.1 hypothetical protein Daura_33995 [Dactylosporangium aurantiacum]